MLEKIGEEVIDELVKEIYTSSGKEDLEVSSSLTIDSARIKNNIFKKLESSFKKNIKAMDKSNKSKLSKISNKEIVNKEKTLTREN